MQNVSPQVYEIFVFKNLTSISLIQICFQQADLRWDHITCIKKNKWTLHYE